MAMAIGLACSTIDWGGGDVGCGRLLTSYRYLPACECRKSLAVVWNCITFLFLTCGLVVFNPYFGHYRDLPIYLVYIADILAIYKA